jgi:hypothetical protein
MNREQTGAFHVAALGRVAAPEQIGEPCKALRSRLVPTFFLGPGARPVDLYSRAFSFIFG